MRKIISTLFLFVFFAGNIGYNIFYAYQQHEIKEAVEAQILTNIPDSSLELIVANENNSFRWEEEGKEFYQNGQLYDVAKSVFKDGKTILYCINDRKEEELLFHFEKTLNSGNNKEGTQTPKVQVIDFLDENICNSCNNYLVLKQTYYSFNSPIITYCKEVNVPPPRL